MRAQPARWPRSGDARRAAVAPAPAVKEVDRAGPGTQTEPRAGVAVRRPRRRPPVAFDARRASRQDMLRTLVTPAWASVRFSTVRWGEQPPTFADAVRGVPAARARMGSARRAARSVTDGMPALRALCTSRHGDAGRSSASRTAPRPRRCGLARSRNCSRPSASKRPTSSTPHRSRDNTAANHLLAELGGPGDCMSSAGGCDSA